MPFHKDLSSLLTDSTLITKFYINAIIFNVKFHLTNFYDKMDDEKRNLA